MPNCQFFVPLDYEEESNETLIAKKTIKIVDCSNSVSANELCGLWNFNKCPNDDSYCNPFVSGDKIYFQSILGAKTDFKKIIPLLYDSATGETIEPVDGLLTGQFGALSDNENIYANLVIDTSLLPDAVSCFYLKITAYKCDLDRNEDYHNCVDDRIGEGYAEYIAKAICADAYCEDRKTYYSEPYCKVRCEEPTLLLTGSYPGFDCDGNYYGVFGGGLANIMIPQIRIYGEIQYQNFTFEEIVVNNIRTSIKRKTNFILQSRKLPLYVVKQIAKIFGSQKVLIDGVEYKGAVTINKNFDEGQMWILKENIYTLCDEINFTCE